MNKLTAQEIIDRLKESHMSPEEFAFEEVPFTEEEEKKFKEVRKEKGWDSEEFRAVQSELIEKNKKYFKNLVGEWEEIEQVGGEGQGDHWHSVKYFPDHDVYLKITGYYQSHYGTDIDGWGSVKEVKPKEKKVVFYE